MTDRLPHCPECGAVLNDPADHSDAARRRYFAILRDAWHNLPDNWRPLCPTAEHLRKMLLVKVGYCEVTAIHCGNNRVALETAALAKRLDCFCVCDVRGAVLTVAVARSQRKRHQPKKAFMECAEAVYMELGKMLGVDPAELTRKAA